MTAPETPPAQVTVLPGVPGMEDLTVDDGVVPFPDTTSDFVKILRHRGISVEYAVPRAERVYVGHKALELWLPILDFAREVLIGMESGLLVELLMSYLKPRTEADVRPELESSDRDAPRETGVPPILHVEWHVTTAAGERATCVANGSMPDVLNALAQFEDHVRNDQGE